MLESTPVSRCLDKKSQIFGYELIDLFAIFFSMAILNFLFGSTSMKLTLVWLPTLALAIALRVGKRGKPDNYLLHLGRFHLRPKSLSAFLYSTKEYAKPPKLNEKVEVSL